MKEITNEEVIEATRVLKKYCICHYNPNGKCNCMFADNVICRVGIPKDFKNIGRWSKNDIELAKSLKRCGAVAVRRFEGSSTPYWQSQTIAGITDGGYLPKGSFNSLTNNEIVDLDDIINEVC